MPEKKKKKDGVSLKERTNTIRIGKVRVEGIGKGKRGVLPDVGGRTANKRSKTIMLSPKAKKSNVKVVPAE